MFARLATLLRSVFRRSRLEADMDAELRFHLQARADDLQRGGMPRGMAERQARLEFGAVDGWKDDCRRERGLALLDEVIGNLRFASRSLRDAPGVTAAAVVSLALGIGANTAIFYSWRGTPRSSTSDLDSARAAERRPEDGMRHPAQEHTGGRRSGPKRRSRKPEQNREDGNAATHIHRCCRRSRSS